MIENFQNFNMPRYEKVRLHIQTLLMENKCDKDMPLPTEQELAHKYQVSVGTVRKAVEKLVEDGILMKQQGRGTFLKEPDFENSLLRFFKFRNTEAGYVVPIGIVKKIMLTKSIDVINEKLNLDVNQDLIYLERVRTVDNKVILSERIWLSQSLFQPFTTLVPEDFESLLYPFYYKKCRQFVSSAIEKLSFIKNHVDTYLDAREQDNFVKVCRIAKNLKGDPIEYRESYGLAENFSYEINIH